MSSKRLIIGFGIDSADPVLMEEWMQKGYLKNIQKLMKEGSYGYVKNTVNYAGQPTETCSTERLWTMTWTGCRPDKTGFWDTSKFYPQSYNISRDEEEVAADFNEYPPFYAVGKEHKVAIFDLPATGLSEQVDGLQVLAWGGHYPFTPSHSKPASLLDEINQKYGKNEVLNNDDGHWSDAEYVKWLYPALQRSVRTRTQICRDLLGRDDWDLFLAAFPETHSAGHDLLHLSRPDHPVHDAWRRKFGEDVDPTLAIYEQVDQSIGQILEDVPDDAFVFCFSVHGMGNNVTDLLSMGVLPELMYRFNFPGKVALAPGKVGTVPPAVITQPVRRSWEGENWVKNHESNPVWQRIKRFLPKRFLADKVNGLSSPWALRRDSVAAAWMPGMWYSPLWPEMKAFALPAFADGHIRINLKGRERDGIVLPEEYDALCEEIIEVLYDLKDSRTGQPLVDKVVKTRGYPTEDNDRERMPGADLVILWNKNGAPVDVADSSRFGRIGPLLHHRPGGHRPKGFLITKGPGIVPGSIAPDVEAVDIAPTMLSLLDVSIPDHLDGHPIDHVVLAKAGTEV
ncbi:alkaline phosphatase family protein [Nodosilinea sp. LEGE 07088]|uniref:alkaline phosphatase family protein n=1 Tax=Nodosilinea sp. LEGE 07088 TaxID=2777968 RepID=UPI001880B516|nr:alkaline phosphatase family protein [Nodosilinea sp. LEGE 07088]MBE9137696.1 alkaline phosphatase family protein [Nodosilinea sp. LEGE 07088]